MRSGAAGEAARSRGSAAKNRSSTPDGTAVTRCAGIPNAWITSFLVASVWVMTSLALRASLGTRKR